MRNYSVPDVSVHCVEAGELQRIKIAHYKCMHVVRGMGQVGSGVRHLLAEQANPRPSNRMIAADADSRRDDISRPHAASVTSGPAQRHCFNRKRRSSE